MLWGFGTLKGNTWGTSFTGQHTCLEYLFGTEAEAQGKRQGGGNDPEDEDRGLHEVDGVPSGSQGTGGHSPVCL